MHRTLRLTAALLLLGVLSACGSSSSIPTRSVTIAWDANRESGVNRAGGGYRVTVGGAAPVDVPYVSGDRAPTSLVVKLAPGTYAVTVVAYAALDARGGTTGSVSAPSDPFTLTVP